MGPKGALVGAGIVALLAYQEYRIRALTNSLCHLSDSFLEHVEASFQEAVDEEFDLIIEENFDE